MCVCFVALRCPNARALVSGNSLSFYFPLILFFFFFSKAKISLFGNIVQRAWKIVNCFFFLRLFLFVTKIVRCGRFFSKIEGEEKKNLQNAFFLGRVQSPCTDRKNARIITRRPLLCTRVTN